MLGFYIRFSDENPESHLFIPNKLAVIEKGNIEEYVFEDSDVEYFGYEFFRNELILRDIEKGLIGRLNFEDRVINSITKWYNEGKKYHATFATAIIYHRVKKENQHAN